MLIVVICVSFIFIVMNLLVLYLFDSFLNLIDGKILNRINKTMKSRQNRTPSPPPVTVRYLQSVIGIAKQQLQPTRRQQTPTKSASKDKMAEILAMLQKCFAFVMKTLDELIPIPPEASLGIIGGFFLLLIFCCCCCCCRYCRKTGEKVKKKKEKLDLKNYPLFGPNYLEKVQCQNDELDYDTDTLAAGDSEIKLGKVKFMLAFDGEENIATVTVVEATDIPAADISGFSDPYVKVGLTPASKKTYKTKVVQHTLHPVFNASFRFKNITYAALTNSLIHLKLFDYDRFSGHDLLGEARVPVMDLDLTKKVEEWRILVPEFKAEKLAGKHEMLGHICVSVAYHPMSSTFCVFVLNCKSLKSTDEGGFSDPFVKFWVVQDGKKVAKRKTTVKMRTLNPAYNERFVFKVDFEKIETTSILFIVADYDKGEKGEPIGELLIGALATGKQLKQWTEMRRNPGKPIAKWHRLREPTVPE